MTITIVFLSIIFLLIYLQKRRENNWINLISILMTPYFVLVFLNNFFVYKTGFYKINDSVLIMLLVSFLLFYVGGRVFNVRGAFLNQENENLDKFKNYNMNSMIVFLYAIGIIALLKLLTLYFGGQFNASNVDTAEGIMGNGPVGHLLLCSYAILPIVFLYWTYTKKIWHLIPVLLIFVATFATLVKYNIIGVFVSLFIFLLIYKKSILKRAVLVLVFAVLAIFIGNYTLTFAIKGVNVSSSFYLGHLWTYMSGSLIYDNYIFTKGIRIGISTGYKLMTFLSALPNMFINAISGTKIFPHERQQDLLISSFGENSNVVDAIGYLFPSKGDISDIILYGMVIFIIGFIFTGIYKWGMKKSDMFNTFIANFLSYFVFFSFFGTFYINSSPWEILVYSLIIPSLFFRTSKPFTIRLR